MISLSPLGLLAIKSIVITGLAWMAYLFTKQLSPKIRYFTLQLFFFILALLPLSIEVFPEWHWSYTSSFIQPVAQPQDASIGSMDLAVVTAAIDSAKTCINSAEKSIVEDLYTLKPDAEASTSSAMTWRMTTHVIWMLGIVIFLFQLGRELFLLRRLAQSRVEIDNHPVLNKLWSSLAAVNPLPSPKFILDNSTQIPFTFGFRNPVIVLPPGAILWPEERLKAVLLHEAAHINHQDFGPNIIRRLACCFFWWNYPIWILSKQVQLESEKRADHWVISHEISPYDYATQLVQITRLLQTPKFSMVSSIGHASQLRNRVEYVIKEDSSTPVRMGIFSKFTLLSLGCLTILSACFQTEARSALSSHTALQQQLHAPVDQLTPLIWQTGEEENAAAVTPLQELLSHDSAQVRSLAAWALGEIKDQSSFTALQPLLEDEDSWVQEMAIRSIGELEVPASLELINPFLYAPHLHLRLAAVQAIADIGVPRGTTLLWNAIQTWPPAQRTAAIQKIGEYGNYCAVPLLSDLLREEPASNLDAIVGLGKLKAKESLSTLLPLLSHKDSSVRVASAKSLGMIGDARALHHLLPLLRDESSEVREVTVWALDEIRA